MLILYTGTDQVLRIPGITDRDGAAQEDASVEVTLLTRAGAEVMAATAATFVESDADGAAYELALGDDLNLAARSRLRARIVVTLADGQTTRTIWAAVYVSEDAA